MLFLSLFWMAVGVALGALANGARWGLQARDTPRWRATLGTLAIGMVGALLVGWVGVLVLGRPFGTPAALWGGILAALMVPWLLARGHKQLS
jgi:hypothetical protein